MANYTKTTNFATKDSLSSGDPAKKIKGTEFNTEFDAIATAVATKADLASPALTGTPTAPTASSGTNTTQIATTAFVASAVSAAGGGTVSSVAMTVPTFLSVTGSPITDSGTLAVSLSGTALPVANGGTGQTSFTDGQLLIGNSSGNTLTKATLTAGSGVSITNGNGSITIAATGTSGVSTFSGGSTGLTPSTATSGAITLGGTLAVANGGTGSTTASGARSNLGLGTIATQNSSSVSITGGSISGITDLAIADGGTGASTASQARTNLGLGTLATLNTATIATGGTGVTALPSFSAYATTSQTLTENVATKVTFGSEDWDTNNCFASSRFTPTTAGYYQISGVIRFNPGSGTTGSSTAAVGLYKNGAEAFRASEATTDATIICGIPFCVLVYLNGSTDYVEIYAGFDCLGTLGTGAGLNYNSEALTSRVQGQFVRGA